MNFGYFGEFFSGILVYRYPPWPTLTKAIANASFYWDDSETVFLVFLRSTSQCYTCQLFLSQMREILTLLWPIFPETSRRLPKDFRRITEDFRTLPKIRCPQMFWKTFEHFRSYLKDDTSSALWHDFVRTRKRTQSHHVLRIICSDLWVRREKLRSLRSNDADDN